MKHEIMYVDGVEVNVQIVAYSNHETIAGFASAPNLPTVTAVSGTEDKVRVMLRYKIRKAWRERGAT